MQKDFLTITPDSGRGSQAVTVKSSPNTGNARSTTITISGGGITRTIDVIQAQGRFTASKTGSIQFYNNTGDYITSRLYLRLISSNNENEYISLCERLNQLHSGKKETEQISGEVQWEGSQTFTTNKCNLIISSGKNENIDITLNGQTLVEGTFTSQQEVRFSTITISPGDTLRVSGTVRYS
jgi:hypothetical protein